MDRASDSGSEGWGFESLPAYQKIQIPIRVSGFFVFQAVGESLSFQMHPVKGCRWELRTMPPSAYPGVYFFWFMPEGTRKGGLSEAKVRKCPVDTFLARGRVPPLPDASRRDVDGNGKPHPPLCFFPSNFPSFLVDIATFFYFSYIFLLFLCIFAKRGVAFFILICYTL